MDQLHLMSVFVAVGEEQSFAAAARRMDLSPAAVTRAIAGLEEVLGVKLLLRTTRNVRLTEAGQRYLEDVRIILASIIEANQVAAGVNAEPRGNLSVTASVLFGKSFVTPCIVDYLKQFPRVEVSAYFLDRVVNLVDEGMDVAVRIGQLPDSSLKAVRVGQVRRVLCASPEYLARNGIPMHPGELLQHAVIAANGISPRVEWKFGKADNPTTVRVKPRFSVSSNDAAIASAVAGLGITRLLSYMISNELTDGSLKIVLADYEEEPWPVNIVHREGKFSSLKVRNFIDMLALRLRANPFLN